ncbi:heme oxygenase [Novosphingobium taihuense]|nr:heme oxygenase [Novosphingobium taihuense]
MFLREQTRADHDRVDEAFGQFDLAHRDDYRLFLLAQASALASLETSLDEAGAGQILGDWPARQRSHLLKSDLSDLGADFPLAKQPALTFSSTAEVLGALYVIEGSRLGGAMLARRVPEDLPRRFLGDSASLRWRTLVDLLDRKLISPDDKASALASARKVFRLFEEAALAQAGGCVLEY